MQHIIEHVINSSCDVARFHSQWLTGSNFVHYPPLINMLKFSGYASKVHVHTYYLQILTWYVYRMEAVFNCMHIYIRIHTCCGIVCYLFLDYTKPVYYQNAPCINVKSSCMFIFGAHCICQSCTYIHVYWCIHIHMINLLNWHWTIHTLGSYPAAQFALMFRWVHGIVQITLHSAFRCTPHRTPNQHINRYIIGSHVS